MPLAEYLRLGAQLPGGFEWIILLIIIAVLLLFGPKKLPELARSIGRAWGELRRGKMEVEREIRSELSATEAQELGGRIRDSARELGIDVAGKGGSRVKPGNAPENDSAPDDP